MSRPLITLPPGLAKRWATAQARAAMAGAIRMIYHAIDGGLVFAIGKDGLVREFHDLGDFEATSITSRAGYDAAGREGASRPLRASVSMTSAAVRQAVRLCGCAVLA